ncbi:MAG: riboflavin synthase [Candidatus Omnitrophica bacterium]|nr:riboflavin synthase [Candidatus Omnitrophota bacterium]MBU4473608.1 riboflavin synthase [Candidatus Omnitrophota bacterium]MCG2706325.1 riboflavin synthase [Candidatus Omnitrophota bacterium]
MFSGIVEELGQIRRISRRGAVTLLEIKAEKTLEDTGVGDSISVNGTCLTVIKKEKDTLSFEVMPKTLEITDLGPLRIRDKVNLERALRIGDRLSGHFVSGHVDCIGIIRKKSYINNNFCFEIAFPPKFIGYILPRGSIAVDGISLTIAEKKSNTFSIYIIPHTLKNTTLGFKGPSDKVNIEFDLLKQKS